LGKIFSFVPVGGSVSSQKKTVAPGYRFAIHDYTQAIVVNLKAKIFPFVKLKLLHLFQK
jgi:hypothetical protein